MILIELYNVVLKLHHTSEKKVLFHLLLLEQRRPENSHLGGLRNCEKTRIKYYDWRSEGHRHYWLNKVSNERRPITEDQYNNDSAVTDDGRLAI